MRFRLCRGVIIGTGTLESSTDTIESSIGITESMACRGLMVTILD